MPGQPFANMVRQARYFGDRFAADRDLHEQLFKVYAAQCIGTGLSFVQDLKLGHYMKIPPRTTFAGERRPPR